MRIGVGSVLGAVLYVGLSCLIGPAVSGIAFGSVPVSTSQSPVATPDLTTTDWNSDVAAHSASAVQPGLNRDAPQNDTAILALEQLEATIAVLQDRVEARHAEIAALQEQRTQLEATVKSGKEAVKSIEKQLQAAQKAYGASRTKLERAKARRDTAAEAQRKAKAAAEQADADAAVAEAAVTRATSEQASATAAEREISRKLVASKYGSAAYRRAFTQWQNAAVAKQAAQARAVLAEERASSSAVGRAAVQEEFSEAGARYSQAQEAATAAAVAFADRKVAVAKLSAQSDSAVADLAKTSERVRGLAEELAQIEQAQRADKTTISRSGKQVAKLREQLVAAGVAMTSAPSATSGAAANTGSRPATVPPSPGGRGNDDSAVTPITGTESAALGKSPIPAASPALTAGQTYGAATSLPQSPGGTNWRLLTAVAALGAGVVAAVMGLWLLRRPRHDPEAGD